MCTCTSRFQRIFNNSGLALGSMKGCLRAGSQMTNPSDVGDMVAPIGAVLPSIGNLIDVWNSLAILTNSGSNHARGFGITIPILGNELQYLSVSRFAQVSATASQQLHKFS